MALDLVTIEHSPHAEILTQPAAQVAFPLSQEDKQLIKEMTEKVLALQGVGLAAPQVGVSKQIIVYLIPEEAKLLRKDADEVISPTVLINPEYTPLPDAKIVYDWEGCFSVAQTTGTVPRYDKITYSAQTLDGKKIQETAKGFTARVLQHEIDHVHSTLIIHRFTSESIQGDPLEMMAIRFKTMTPEEKEMMKKMIAKREKSLDPADIIRVQTLEKAKALLKENKSEEK